jgi:hypothetical protein
MEHRELPPLSGGDLPLDGTLEQPTTRFRLRRFDPDGDVGPMDFRRLGLRAIAALATFAGLIFLGIQGTRIAVGWLHHQPQYQFPFSRIRLLPEPPPWYRGGAQEFLKRVRHGAGECEHIATLDVVPERLALAFKKYAWVEDVTRVTIAPGRIECELRYRQPVAWVDLSGGKQHIVDAHAIILQADEIDPDQLGQVIKISGEGLSAPADPRAGVIWKWQGSATDLGQPDPRIEAAAKLAGFVKAQGRIRDGESSRALRVIEIIVTDFASRGLFMMNAEGAEIWWGRTPGDEAPGTLTAEQKWTMLVDWQRSTRARFLVDGDYWAFSRKGVYHACPHAKSPHEPSEVSLSAKDREKWPRRGGSG